MRHVDADARRKKILSAIVESYIETAAPIGSRAISQRFRHSVSPATVRNVMADLEDMGFVTHPHTSAGRVPTDKGYRFYVNSLLEPKHLTKEEESAVTKLLNKKYEDFDALMHNVSSAINLITNMAGIVLTPRFKRSTFKQIEFIPVDASRVLIVLITGSGLVKNVVLDAGEKLNRSELSRISAFLNEELEGMFLGDIKNHLTRKLLEERDSFYSFLKKATSILQAPGLLKMDDRVYFEGTTSLMSYPEFSDVSKAKLFLKLLEEKQDILDLFSEDMESEGVKVHIGKENICKHIHEFTVVTCNYKIKDRVIGALGAIGPTRMEYGKVISAVKYMSDTLERVLEEIG